jgi:4-hydroxy-tetrahydrodipicolinate reductase
MELVELKQSWNSFHRRVEQFEEQKEQELRRRNPALDEQELHLRLKRFGEHLPAADPRLVPTQSLADGALAQSVVPNQRTHQPPLFKLAQALKAFPQEYNFSISEIHHTGKKDAPSGTAKKLGEIIANVRGYSKTISGREGISPRQTGELEISALRVGGVPGIHDLIVAGPHEMLRIEHTAFSRSVFAQGAVYAAEWLSKQNEPKVFSIADVLGLS